MRSKWSNQIAANLDGLDLLVYATRLIGQDPDLVLWGGGNSSLKTTIPDHMGNNVRVLWIKGSGSDMRTITAKQFTPLRLDELLLLSDREEMSDEEIVSYQAKCGLDPTAPKPSIETLLHAFLPAPHIYHTHADVICALTNIQNSEAIIQQVYGDDVAVVPYVRPGFGLAKRVGRTFTDHSRCRAIILDKHGLVTWGNDPKAAYQETVRMVKEANDFLKRMGTSRSRVFVTRVITPTSSPRTRREQAAMVAGVLRGKMSQPKPIVLSYDDSPEVLGFLNGEEAQRLSEVGPVTPDHILHTKAKPLFLDLSEQLPVHAIDLEIEKGVEQYRQAYVRYFEEHKTPGMVMQDPNPRVILIPGLGMFTSGKNRRACRIAHDLFLHKMRVISAASSIGRYVGLSPKNLFDFEYWPLETYKLTLLSPEKELSRRIALVTGAAGAIGREVSAQLVQAGVSVILTDVNERELHTISKKLNEQSGEENTIAIPMDVTDETSVVEAFRKAALAYGGLDILVSNAGIACSVPLAQLSLADWENSIAVNATGNFLVCREAMRLFQYQGMGGNIVVISTKNVPAPGKNFGAYSASKAAQAQLTRVLAIEGAEQGIRVNMVNPDAIFDGSGLWSKETRQSRAKAYGIPVENLETFCISRNLLKVKITAQDVAEAVLFLASDRSAKTTGTMIPVDGGFKEAFPR